MAGKPARSYPYVRPIRKRSTRLVLLTLVVLLALDVLFLMRATSHSSPQPSRLLSQDKRPPQIFLASTHWNNESRLRGFWNKAVIALADHLGPENIYVSIYESGSWDDSKGALRELDAELERLGVQRTIVLEEATHAVEISKPPATEGWIETPRGKREVRRIPFLANLRNVSLKPLANLALNGIKFDKVLFLNDVAFSVEDVMTLLDTNGGSYAAACSLDFMQPPAYYDTFALRDSEGHEPVTATFPYFRSRASRNAMIAGKPVPVQSCWNGAVVMDAQPFYEGANALRFRGIPDSLAKFHLEASECCLIHIDNHLSASRGVWLNPHARVGYTPEAYDTVRGDNGLWPSPTDRILGIWRNRLRRWLTFTIQKSRRVNGRIAAWERLGEDLEYEPGPQCLINEMQVLVENGWAHV